MDQLATIKEVSLLKKSLRSLLSLKSLRNSLTYTLSIIGTFYFLGIDYWNGINTTVTEVISRFFILKFIAIGLAIGFTFYWILPFLLRLVFHVKLRALITKRRNELLKIKNYSDKRVEIDTHKKIESFLAWIIQLGYLTRKEIDQNRNEFCASLRTEDFLNYFLVDIYKWICVVIHLLLTTMIVWMIKIWIILGVILILFILSLIALGIIFITLHPEAVERILSKLVSEKSESPS